MLILRYSNFETDTLAAHRAALKSNGSVYWGWWKKDHEEFPTELLRRLSDRAVGETIRIGLVARADAEYAVATCSEVTFSDDGELIATPQESTTPDYYAAEKCAAWFRFDEIDDVPLEKWTSEFGPVPTGDPTLFESIRGRPDEYPTPVVSVAAKAGQYGVLHISDLHFGDDHGFGTHVGPTVGPRKLAEIIAEGLPSPPACVVVSGDLTTKSGPDGFLSARAFLEELVRLLDVDRDAVVLVPGNHDILIEDPELTRDYKNEQQFRDLLQLFYERSTELERVHDIRDESGRHYVVGTLNSSRPRHRETMDYGYVGNDRSAPVFQTVRMCADLARSDVWVAVVLHHHLLPGPLVEEPETGRPVSMTLDAGEIVSLAQTHGADALLHGHQHIPFIGTVSRVAEFTADGATDRSPAPAVTILGAGSAGVSRGRIPDSVGLNTYSVYQPFETAGTVVECFGFLEKRNVHSLWRLTIARSSTSRSPRT
jgi:3',5'-cyclic AMP phosphodiesterase CpdA